MEVERFIPLDLCLFSFWSYVFNFNGLFMDFKWPFLIIIIIIYLYEDYEDIEVM